MFAGGGTHEKTKFSVGGSHPENPLQRARVKAGLTQEKAAEVLGCNLRTLQRFEEGREGRKGPPIEMLLKMRRCYCCEIGDLIQEKDLLGETDRQTPTEHI